MRVRTRQERTILAISILVLCGAGCTIASGNAVRLESGELSNGILAFGHAVAVSANTAVTGANTDPLAPDAVYVYERWDGGWLRTSKLQAPMDGQPVDGFGDEFGWSIAVSEDGSRFVVGAPFGAVCKGNEGMGPRCADRLGILNQGEGLVRSGTAYVFEREGLGWAASRLVAADPGADDRFGFSVAISGSTILVGAPQRGANHGADQTGKAYLFEMDPATGSWQQAAELSAEIPVSGSGFGSCVALSGPSAVVGVAPSSSTGAVYVFEKDAAGEWGEPGAPAGTRHETLAVTGGNPGFHFGSAVAVCEDTLAVGGYGAFTNVGAVWILRRDASTWAFQDQLLGSDSQGGDQFGWSVALHDTTLVIGARGDRARRGAAYIFESRDGGWVQTEKLSATRGRASDDFGHAVSVSKTTAVVGSPGDDWDDCERRCVREGSAWAFELVTDAPDAPALLTLDSTLPSTARLGEDPLPNTTPGKPGAL